MTPDDTGPFELGTDGPTTILVGVDGSTTSMRAGWYAAGLAHRQRARMVAVYVGSLAPAGVSAGSAELVAARLDAFNSLAAELRKSADEVAAELGITVSFIATRGEPFTEIRRIADEIRADAIVVGASAKAGHRFVGSLAVRLVRASKWPVTVVP